MIALPPLLDGGSKLNTPRPSRATTDRFCGADAAIALIATLRVTCAAALKLALPAWLAAMVQVPTATCVTFWPVTVQTLGVVELVGDREPDDAVANGLIEKLAPAEKLRLEGDCAGKVMV